SWHPPGPPASEGIVTVGCRFVTEGRFSAPSGRPGAAVTSSVRQGLAKTCKSAPNPLRHRVFHPLPSDHGTVLRVDRQPLESSSKGRPETAVRGIAPLPG